LAVEGDESSLRSRHLRGVFFDFAAPTEDAGLASGGFGFLDLAVFDVADAEAAPGELIVGAQFGEPDRGGDGLGVAAELHQRHGKRVPGVGKLGVEFRAAPVFFHGGFQVAEGKVAVGVVKKFLCVHG
jgi:hypothetical protein